MNRKLLAIALAMVLMLGVVPGLPLQTAYAASFTVSAADELYDALAALPIEASSTITLGADITYGDEIYLNRKMNVTFVLAGHTLEALTRIRVGSYAKLNIDDSAGGSLNAKDGILADGGGMATLSSVSSASINEAVLVYDDSSVIIKGNVSAQYAVAIQATNEGSVVTVYGSVTSGADQSAAVKALGGSRVTINGSVSGTRVGVYADGAQITVGGNVTGGECGAYAEDGSAVTVNGTVTAPSLARVHELSADTTVQSAEGGYTVYRHNNTAEDASTVRIKLPASATAPAVTSGAVSGVTAAGAALCGEVTSDGGAAVTDRGFVYGAAADPAIGGAGVTQAVAGSGTGEFTATITGLAADTSYHLRAYATNSAGTSYGADVSFMTLSTAGAMIPTVSTGARSVGADAGLAANQLYAYGNVTKQGFSEVTERGILYYIGDTCPDAGSFVVSGSPYHDPAVVQVPASAGGAGEYRVLITNASSVSVKYWFRAYAINGNGKSYGRDILFTVLPGSPVTTPSVTNNAASNVTASGAALCGNVTSDGGAAVTQRGFVYGAAADPVIGGAGVTQAAAGSGAGEFTATIAGLAANTTYHARAYATNSEGTSYGEDVSFATLADTDPTLTPGPTLTPTPVPTPSDDIDDVPQTGDDGRFPAAAGIAGLALLGGALLQRRRQNRA